jgi:hypothetical protein
LKQSLGISKRLFFHFEMKNISAFSKKVRNAIMVAVAVDRDAGSGRHPHSGEKEEVASITSNSASADMPKTELPTSSSVFLCKNSDLTHNTIGATGGRPYGVSQRTDKSEFATKYYYLC